MSDLVYRYNPNPDKPWFKEGVTTGWLVLHEGVGPAKMKKVAALVDDEGQVVFVDAGEWEDTTVYDDAKPVQDL